MQLKKEEEKHAPVDESKNEGSLVFSFDSERTPKV